MSEIEAPSVIDRERVERHLRSVRTKLISARRQLQTLVRQAGMARGAHRMDNEIGRAERHVQELEQTEAELVKQLEEPAAGNAHGQAEAARSEGESA